MRLEWLNFYKSCLRLLHCTKQLCFFSYDFLKVCNLKRRINLICFITDKKTEIENKN